MKGGMKKLLIGLVVVSVAIFLFFKFYGASLVKSGIEEYGPEFTGTSVTVSDISFSPLRGRFGLEGFIIGNPPNYTGEKAFSLGIMNVEMKTSTLLSNVVFINNLTITDPEFVVEIKNGKLNARTILDHLNQYVEAEEESETRVKIENLSITGGKVMIMGLPVESKNDNFVLPDIHMSNIGMESETGVTVAEASEEVLKEVVGALTRVVAENKIKGFLGGFSGKMKGLFGGDDEDNEEEEPAEEGN